MDTKFALSTCHSPDGAYEVGAEYCIDGDRVVHFVHRAVLQEIFVGYGLVNDADHGIAILRVSHDGPMTPWRYVHHAYDRTISPVPIVRLPRECGYLNLPDEDHGWTWGDPIEVPSAEPVRYTAGGREITADAAQAALDAYAAASAAGSICHRRDL